MRTATLVAALSVVLGTMGAVTGDQPKSKTHTVTIEGMRFQPEVLTVAPGDTDRVGQQGPGSSHGDVEGRRVRFEGHSGRQVLEIHDPNNG